MAGETPHAQRIADRRRRLDPRATDVPYRSGTPSVFARQPSLDGAIAGTPAPSAPAARRLSHLDERSTDKIYREQRAQPAGTRQPPSRAGASPPPPPGPRSPRGSTAAPGLVRIGAVEDIHHAIDAVVEQLLAGITPVVVEVADEPRDLLRRVRALLDTKVTREIITEDQQRDVRFSRVAASSFAVPPVAAITPAGAVVATPVELPESAPEPDDPAAFLSGEGAVPAVMSVEADEPDAAPEAIRPTDTAPPVAEEEADDGFTFPAAEGSPEGSMPESPAPQSRGRRHGRGAR